MSFAFEHWGWNIVIPMALIILSILLETGRRTSADACGLENVRPPKDIGFAPKSHFMLIYISNYGCMTMRMQSGVCSTVVVY